MSTRFIVCLFIVSLLSACAPREPAIDLGGAGPIYQHRPVGHFNQITVEGVVDVQLHTGYSKPELVLHGDPRDLAYVSSIVNNNHLLLRFTSYPKFGRVTADIHTKDLNAFTYKGAGVVKGERIHSRFLKVFISNPEKTILAGDMNLNTLVVKGPSLVEISGIRSPYLDISLDDKARVTLTGIAKLGKLDMHGNARLNLSWISSDYLMIRAKEKNVIQLAGSVNKLDLELGGSARFNGRYLRASRTFVKTYGNAVAEINSVDRQHTLASGASDIHFYNIPVMKNDFMAYNGAVLDMRDWNMPFMQEYDRYNKDVALGDW